MVLRLSLHYQEMYQIIKVLWLHLMVWFNIQVIKIQLEHIEYLQYKLLNLVHHLVLILKYKLDILDLLEQQRVRLVDSMDARVTLY